MNRTPLFCFFILFLSTVSQTAFSQHHYGIELGAVRGIYAIQNQLPLSYNLSLTYRVQIHTGNN